MLTENGSSSTHHGTQFDFNGIKGGAKLYWGQCPLYLDPASSCRAKLPHARQRDNAQYHITDT